MTKTPRREIQKFFVHPKSKALDVLPIVEFACANGLKSIRSMRAGSSTLLIPGACDLQVQVSIYLSTGEGEEVWGHPLKGEKVFAADLSEMFSTQALRSPRELTCAIICFCVSRGRSRRFNLPSGLSVTFDLPLERLLGPDASDFETFIAGGKGGNGMWVKAWLGAQR